VRNEQQTITKKRRPRKEKIMPNTNSFADLLRDWELLLRAFQDSAEVLAPAEPQRAALDQILTAARDLKAGQDSHAAARQQMTQELSDLVRKGREQARRLRGMAKGLLGTDNERLVQFKVAPVRSRPRKAVQKPVPTPPPPPAPPPAPEISGGTPGHTTTQ
jgi:hypothetical protein